MLFKMNLDQFVEKSVTYTQSREYSATCTKLREILLDNSSLSVAWVTEYKLSVLCMLCGRLESYRQLTTRQPPSVI